MNEYELGFIDGKDKLQEEIERLNKILVLQNVVLDEWLSKEKGLLEEIERLNKLLKKYGNHKISCRCAKQMIIDEDLECTCGFEKVLKGK